MTFKKLTAAAAVGACILCATASANDISVIVDGVDLDFTGDQAPVIVDDRTLVPVRAIFEALGAQVQWDADTQTVLAAKGEDITVLQIGSQNMFVNSVSTTIDVPAQIIGDRTMVPVRAVSEAFECDVEWDELSYTVTVTSPEAEEQTEDTSEVQLVNPITEYGSLEELNAALEEFNLVELPDSDYTPTEFLVYNTDDGQMAAITYENGDITAEVRATTMDIEPSGISGGEKIDSVTVADTEFDICSYGDYIYCDFKFTVDDVTYSMSVAATGLTSAEELIPILAGAASVMPIE